MGATETVKFCELGDISCKYGKANKTQVWKFQKGLGVSRSDAKDNMRPKRSSRRLMRKLGRLKQDPEIIEAPV